MRRILAIDPGVDTGYALFEPGNKTPVDAGIWYGKGEHWLEKFASICDQLDDYLNSYKEVKVVIEEPAVMFGSAKATASTSEGSTVKLSMVVGGLIHVARYYVDANIELIPVVTWKGNLSKRTVRERAEAITGALLCKSHAIDAVGLGLFYLGYFK